MGDQAITEVDSGRLRGRVIAGARTFLGIPYASARRFAAPGEPERWTGTRNAAAVGAASPQPGRAVAVFTHGETPPTAEECLNLNVFAPDLGGVRPVLVWVHGGGFAIGHGGASLYDGTALARSAEVVVVTINYRLGDLGWLWHPRLAPEPGAPAGNWGLLDVIAALRWVRRNIVAFGGDPGRVTLAGQSAGALASMDLLCAPAAAGLFERLIAQSPVLVDLAQPPSVAVRWAQALSAACGGVGEFDRAALLAAGPERLVEQHERLLEQPAFRGTRGGALPTLDPALLPRSPLDDPGASPEVDVLIGHTADEGTFFFGSPWRPAPGPERIAGVVAHLCHTDAPDAVLAEYRARAGDEGAPLDDESLLVRIATDAMVAEPVARWARARAATSADRGPGRVFRYRVDHPGAGPLLRATHTVEVPLLFGTWQDGGAGERLAGKAAGAGRVAAELVPAWAGFIRHGSPGWDPIDGADSSERPHVFGGPPPSRS